MGVLAVEAAGDCVRLLMDDPALPLPTGFLAGTEDPERGVDGRELEPTGFR